MHCSSIFRNENTAAFTTVFNTILMFQVNQILGNVDTFPQSGHLMSEDIYNRHLHPSALPVHYTHLT